MSEVDGRGVGGGYPVVLVGAGRMLAVVVGGGQVGSRKVEGLLAAGIRVRLVSPSAGERLAALADGRVIEWERRAYRAGDLDGASLAFAATSQRQANRDVADDARAAGILCNVADAPGEGSFIVPAVHRSAGIVLAVSTDGVSPSRAAAVRDRLAAALDAPDVP
ncbi:MAG: precorrin-2 dehydrogenase/sirohydrochlorin ferrochelatase family protein [Candidatus Limnocylindrales bacterium]